ncbi:MAG TPA: glycogen-binding domain-containing protein [Longimicrobium sp.]|nr:glycogen-binding domain-containing protein [Longimicrobium sp.]
MSNDRIHAWLDGDLPLEALNDDEREEALALRAFFDAAAEPLRATPAPDLSARVMAALPPAATPGKARSPFAGVLEWLWSPRPVRLTFRPAYGVAFACVAAAALALPRPNTPAALVREPLPTVVAHRPGTPPVYVQFRIRVPGAHQVQLAGTFTGWKPEYALSRSESGEWTVLVPLRPGVHDYAFVVDGDRWVADPNAPQVDDSFGGTNSRISLPPIGAS